MFEGIPNLVISLQTREDRRERLRANWSTVGMPEPLFMWGNKAARKSIPLTEIFEMEAYGSAENLRGDYALAAVGCKRAGIRALRHFLFSTRHDRMLICEDDCHWLPNAADMVNSAMNNLPDAWDLLYFSAYDRTPTKPENEHWRRLTGARLCTAILWSRLGAEKLLRGLQKSGREIDYFLEMQHPQINAFRMAEMPAYQNPDRSDISGHFSNVQNRAL